MAIYEGERSLAFIWRRLSIENDYQLRYLGHMNAIADTVLNPVQAATTTLAELKPGESGQILSMATGHASCRRLLALGFVPGTRVIVRRIAPLRDPVEYCVRGACVSLRRSEASTIVVGRVG